MSGERYAWSSDGEVYVGDFASIERAFEDAEAEGCERPWIGKAGAPMVEQYVDADLILEHITCQDDYTAEVAEEWPFATVMQCHELTEALQKVVAEWVDKHKLWPTFFVVRNAKRYERDGLQVVEVKGGER